jgi:hypothetical protein
MSGLYHDAPRINAIIYKKQPVDEKCKENALSGFPDGPAARLSAGCSVANDMYLLMFRLNINLLYFFFCVGVLPSSTVLFLRQHLIVRRREATE